MTIGVPKEVKDHESRVGVTPGGVKALVEAGHKVLVEHDAGALSAMPDDEYQNAGAEIVGSAYDVWRLSDMIVKVKEPTEKEYRHFRPGLLLFTYLHLAPLRELTDALLEKQVTGIAYETVRDRTGALPLLTPMSEVAGRLSVQIGAQFLTKEHGGRGLLLGGVPGVSPANVCIIGGGIVGTNAAKIALGMGAKVTLLDLNLNPASRARRHLQRTRLYCRLQLLQRRARHLRGRPRHRRRADPRRRRSQDRHPLHGFQDEKGAVIVDVAIDQGGCIETARPTTHSDPSFEVDGVVHYCVTNMPAAVPNTSTLALTNATFPYVFKLARQGAHTAIGEDKGIAEGVNTFNGQLTYQAVAQAQGRDWKPVADLL